MPPRLLPLLQVRFHRRLSSLSLPPPARLSSQPLPPASKSPFYGRKMSTVPETSKGATKQDDGPITFHLEEHGNVPVTVQGLSKDELKEWEPFKNWITTLSASLRLQTTQPTHPFHANPFALRSIHIDSYTKFGPRIGFLKLTADVSNSTPTSLPGVIFLRGPSVAMLVILRPDDAPTDDAPTDDDEAYVLLTVQPRIAAGSLSFVELPAGMLDGSNNFAGKAAQEIQEELGLTIPAAELSCLTDRVAQLQQKKKQGTVKLSSQETLPYAMYPSPGGCDEHIKIMVHERRESRETLEAYRGKATGLREAGEMITLKIVPLKELWIEGGMDAKALAAVTMYQQLKAWEKEQQK